MRIELTRTIGALCVGVWSLAAAAQNADTRAAVEQGKRLFAVEITVGPNWDDAKAPGEQTAFAEHSANLQRLREAGDPIMGARYSDKGLIVLAAGSIDDVRAMMDQDPAMTAGTFVYTVHVFNVFYPGAITVPPKG